MSDQTIARRCSFIPTRKRINSERVRERSQMNARTHSILFSVLYLNISSISIWIPNAIDGSEQALYNLCSVCRLNESDRDSQFFLRVAFIRYFLLLGIIFKWQLSRNWINVKHEQQQRTLCVWGCAKLWEFKVDGIYGVSRLTVQCWMVWRVLLSRFIWNHQSH